MKTPRIALLTMGWMLAACAPTMTAKPTTTAKSKTTSEVAVAQPTPGATARSADEVKYLAAVHKIIGPRWEQVRINAGALLPKSHPANVPSRVTEISARLDGKGQIKRIRVSKTSGCTPYDNSALGTMARVPEYPALPARLHEGHVELRWRFHRDVRSARADHVTVVLHPLSPEEAFSRALARKQWDRARQIMRRHPERQTIRAILAEAGLSSKDVGLNMLALRVAHVQRLLALLENETEMKRWNTVLDVLASRGGHAEMIAHLRWVARPVSRINAEAQASLEARKVASILKALDRMGSRAPTALVNELLSRKDAAIVMAAAPMATDRDAMSRALKSFINDPKVAGPLAVHRLAMGPDAFAEKIAAKALTHKTRMATLRTLERAPVKALAAALEPLVRSHATDEAVRLAAIRALSKATETPAAFYAAMGSSNQRVKVAAIRALGSMKKNTTGICYRLSTIGMKNRNEIGAEALASVARIGDKQFLGAMAYMTSRQRAEQKPVIIASYWGFGKKAVPLLNKLAASADSRVAAAARKSLDRINGVKSAPAAAPTQASPLGDLMQQALTLAKAPAPAKVSVKSTDNSTLAKAAQ